MEPEHVQEAGKGSQDPVSSANLSGSDGSNSLKDDQGKNEKPSKDGIDNTAGNEQLPSEKGNTNGPNEPKGSTGKETGADGVSGGTSSGQVNGETEPKDVKAEHIQERDQERKKRAEEMQAKKEAKEAEEREKVRLEAEKKLQAAEKRESAAEEKRKAAEAAKTKAAEALAAAISAKNTAETRAEKAEEDTKAANAAQASAETRAEKAEEDTKAANAAQASAEKRAEKAEEDMKNANNAKSAAEKKAAQAEKDRKAATAAKTSAEKKAELAEKDKKVANAAKNTAETRADQAEQATKAANAAKEAAEQSQRNAEKELEQLKTAKEAAQQEAKNARDEISKLQQALDALKLASPAAAQALFEEWKKTWEKQHDDVRRVLPRGVVDCDRPVNVKEEDLNPETWTRPKLDDVEEKAREAIIDTVNKLERVDAKFARLERSPRESIVWMSAEDGPKGYRKDLRIPLTRISSIDPSEITCPVGMVVVGVGFGPWMGTNASGESLVDDPRSTHMSIKLLCKDANGNEKLFGNSGPKIAYPGDRMTGEEIPEGVDRNYVPRPASTLAHLFCDTRPVTYERFTEDQGSNEPTQAKAISGLAFHNFVLPTKDRKVFGSRFSLLPTFQDSRCARIVPTPEAIIRVFQDDPNSGNFFRKWGQLTPPKSTNTGIDRLYYDTNIVSYNGWQVTGVQMYLRDTDTIALNVRFQDMTILS